MRKILSLILCLLLVPTLLAGCSDKEAESPTLPPRTEVAKATDPTEDVPETTVAPTEAQCNTVALRDRDIALRRTYILMAISTDAPFLAQGVQLNEAGANALAQWITTEEAGTVIQQLGVEEFGEPIFTPPTEALAYIGKIANATSASKTIRLAVEAAVEESGLTEALLPIFEETYHYEVTVSKGSATSVLGAARSGYADLILLEASELTEALVNDGFVRTVPGLLSPQLRLCSMQYLLCGPREDPAKVASCASVGESFAAIARGQFRFTSRGDGSSAHRLEQQFWPANQEFGDWYHSADMEMGPCLVMNDMEGGYILTDKLTWLIYFSANGII